MSAVDKEDVFSAICFLFCLRSLPRFEDEKSLGSSSFGYRTELLNSKHVNDRERIELRDRELRRGNANHNVNNVRWKVKWKISARDAQEIPVSHPSRCEKTMQTAAVNQFKLSKLPPNIRYRQLDQKKMFLRKNPALTSTRREWMFAFSVFAQWIHGWTSLSKISLQSLIAHHLQLRKTTENTRAKIRRSLKQINILFWNRVIHDGVRKQNSKGNVWQCLPKQLSDGGICRRRNGLKSTGRDDRKSGAASVPEGARKGRDRTELLEFHLNRIHLIRRTRMIGRRTFYRLPECSPN